MKKGMKLNKESQTRLLLLAALFVSCLFIFRSYLFGDSVLVFDDVGGDTWQQYTMHYASIVNHLRAGNFSLWDFTNGMGTNMFSLSLFDPSLILLYLIGVVLGLAVTGKVFNFFSLLGLLGLVGMNIKNAVVLVEQIGVLRAAGKDPYEALTSATRSRIVPVAMASGTTILGMLPLLFDSMFGAMAATIMGGLLVATLLTVCVLPVVYALFYNIRKP